MEAKICQSCGMPMEQAAQFGTEKNGNQSQDYCVYCYKDGEFTKDVTMEGMVEICLGFLDEFNKDAPAEFTREQARAGMMEHFPSLKRWKKN